MNNRRAYLIVLLIVLLAGLVTIFLVMGRQTNFSWTENYYSSNKGPYGTYVITALLKTYNTGHDLNIIKNSFPEELPIDDDQPSNYVFIGNSQYLDSTDVKQLMDYVKAGNRAFVASNSLPVNLMFFLYFEECPDAEWQDLYSFRDTVAHMNLYHPNAQFEEEINVKHVIRDEKVDYDWRYFTYDYFCNQEKGFVELGYLEKNEDEYVNFARVKLGEGYFYLHSNPIAFSNIQLLNESGLNYADRVFSHLLDGPVYWDRYSKNQGVIRQSSGNAPPPPSRTPMQYILSQPALAWAWYILVAIALMYLLFRTKRRQRVIPVLESNTNTSLEFIQTIGQLYFMQSDHKKLALQQMKLLLGYIREHYKLPTRELDTKFQTLLATKSEVPQAQIEDLFRLHRNITTSSIVSENVLIDLNKKIEHFYRICK